MSIHGNVPSCSTTLSDQAMRIALIRQRFRFDGGGERIVSAMLDVLASQGRDVSLIARDWQSSSARMIPCNPGYWTRIQREARFASKAMEIAREQQFDLIQSHERIPGCQVYRAGDGVHRCWLQARSASYPVWKTRLLVGSRYHQYVLRTERAMFEHPHLKTVICNSRMVARQIRANFRIAPEKIRVIYNGVDTRKYSPRNRSAGAVQREQLGISSEVPLAIFVGSGWERKGLSTTLRALTEVDGMELLVVGRDKAQHAFEKLAASLGIRQRVHFAGVCSEMALLYAAADLFVLPTLYDPFPNACMEAFASGLPVITTAQCGAAELIQPGIQGNVVEAGNVSQLTAALRIVNSRDRCEQMGQAATQVVQNMTHENMQRELASLYQDLLPATPLQWKAAG